MIDWYHYAQAYQRGNNFYQYSFLQLCLAYLPGLSYQYRCRNPIEWGIFVFIWQTEVFTQTPVNVLT